jgi:hypothetical protein
MRILLQIDPKYGVGQDDDGAVHIVKIATGEPIPPDEPRVLFRARDRLALIGALVPYRTECRADDCTEFHMRGIQNRIDAFYEFQRDNPARMKQPGCTRGL